MTRLSPATLRALDLVRGGMSQSEAARQAGVNRAAVSRALKARRALQGKQCPCCGTHVR